MSVWLRLCTAEFLSLTPSNYKHWVMGLLDRLKTKKTELSGDTGIAEMHEPAILNEPGMQDESYAGISLEELLQRAGNEPKFRPEFYRRMLTDELIVVMERSQQPENTGDDDDDDSDVTIASFPDGAIPVFTSMDRIYDKGVNKEQLPVMQMQGDKLLALLKGRMLVVNPYSDFGKQLLPEEVDRMLDGTILESVQREIDVQQPMKIALGIPSPAPEDLLLAMRDMLKSKPEVKSAYIGLIHFVETNEPPHFIFAFEGDTDLRHINKEAGELAQRTRPGEMFDFVTIPGQSFDEFFYKHNKPFYVR